MANSAGIRSMTGYGQATAELGQVRLWVELRSLNHRYADLRLRLPAGLADEERGIRRKVLARVKRGRVELTVNVEPIGGAGQSQFNLALAREALGAVKTLRDELGIEGRPDVGTLLGLSGMFRGGPPELEWDEAEREVLAQSIERALEALDRERCREGEHLRLELASRLQAMAGLAAEIRSRAGELPDALRERLVERLGALAPDVGLDPSRVAQEAVILADRADVTEELVRLEGHLEQTRSLLSRPDGDAVGKRLDFLLQEIHRETNTVNSKSADLELSRKALALKAEIEKVREQVQNVE
jgi:uncharacterized protein (TIGR00255 family)